MALNPARLLTSMASLGLVVGSAALLLIVLDREPRLVVGPELETFANVTDLERAVGERLLLPAYFPQSLRWPPSSIRASGRRRSAVALGFCGPEGRAERLFVAQTVRGEGAFPPELLPSAVVLESGEVSLEGERATLQRLKAGDGALWSEVAWSARGRSLRMRSSGSLEELLKMAASVHKEGP